MFKKAKRCNFRRRNDSEDEDKDELQNTLQLQSAEPQQTAPCGPGAGDSGTANADSYTVNSHGNGFQSSALKAAKEKKKKKEGKEEAKASLLSFNDDEEETEVFRVKKSNHSKKIVKQLKKEYREEKSVPVVQDVATRLDGASGPAIVKDEPVDSRGSSEQGEGEMEVDSNDEQEDESEAKPGGGGAFSESLSALSSLRPGEIPDAAFIHAARKRRQLARELGGDAPLMEAEVANKRLVREDEQGGSDDEDEKRIVFSGVNQKSQRQKIAEEIGIEGSDDEALDTEGNDEEVSRWEQEQIRKGISIPQVQSNQPEDTNMYYQAGYEGQPYGVSYNMPYGYAAVGADSSKPVKAEGSVPYPIPSSSLTPITTALVKKRLTDRLSSMRQGRDASARRYEQIQEELQASNSSILQLEDSSQHTAEQYKFLQEMRGYVRDLLECFSEKVPAVLELEAAMHQLLRQRAARRVQRRQDDIKDESAEFSSLSSQSILKIKLLWPLIWTPSVETVWHIRNLANRGG